MKLKKLAIPLMGLALLAGGCGGARDDHEGHPEESHDEGSAHDADKEGAQTGAADEHAGHGHEEGREIKLTDQQIASFGITTARAAGGELATHISLPGEIVFDDDRIVHMVPRVSGIVRSVAKTVGDQVKEGETLAIIDSRELADAKAEYLAATARNALAEKTFIREKGLRDKKVSSEQDYLEAEQALAEASITLRSAEQKLQSLGLSKKELQALNGEGQDAFTQYSINSPMSGVVTAKHLSRGESVASDAEIFTIADASSVWANLTVFTKNLAIVTKGQTVLLAVDHSGVEARGTIAMVTPFVDEATRSATARVVLDNSDGRLMPGTFVTGVISISANNVKVLVPASAVQMIEGERVVFVEEAKGLYEAVDVTTGRSDGRNVEIVSGLKAGDAYVAEGAFELKATVITSTLDSHAGHGH